MSQAPSMPDSTGNGSERQVTGTFDRMDDARLADIRKRVKAVEIGATLSSKPHHYAAYERALALLQTHAPADMRALLDAVDAQQQNLADLAELRVELNDALWEKSERVAVLEGALRAIRVEVIHANTLNAMTMPGKRSLHIARIDELAQAALDGGAGGATRPTVTPREAAAQAMVQTLFGMAQDDPDMTLAAALEGVRQALNDLRASGYGDGGAG